jgi:chromosome segregation ATPase
MADTSEDLKRKIAEQIDAAKQKLDMLKRDIEGMHEEDMAALRERQTELSARLEQQKSRAQQLQARITNWKNEKQAQTVDAIASWKRKLELEKLQKHAARAEDYALDMVTVAANDFEEAEQAVFEAIAARMEADQALPPA